MSDEVEDLLESLRDRLVDVEAAIAMGDSRAVSEATSCVRHLAGRIDEEEGKGE